MTSSHILVVKAEICMASLTIRNIEDVVKMRLRVRAAHHGRSMEDEARIILRDAVSPVASSQPHLVDAIRSRFMAIGGVDLPDIPRDEPDRDPPDFSE
jgi:plasmid stability protein